jgi:hypothetical protein
VGTKCGKKKMSVQFISTSKCKELAGINGNTDDFLVTPMIISCQDDYIERILGTDLYNELKTQVTNNTLTALNTTLLNTYVVPCLVAYVKYEAVIELNYKFTNKSISTKTSENSQPIQKDDAVWLMEHYKNKAEEKAERITRYLMENDTDYPLYLNHGTGLDILPPNTLNYTCGIVLDTCNSCHEVCCKCNLNRP